MGSLAREDLAWETATRIAAVDFPAAGVAHVVWFAEEDPHGTSTWLQRLVTALWTSETTAAGTIEGPKDAVRYAIEAGGTGVAVRDRGSAGGTWYARSMCAHIDIRRRDDVLSLLDAWTPGTVFALSIGGAEPAATIIRAGDGTIVVALGQQAGDEAAAIVARLPLVSRQTQPMAPTPRRRTVWTRSRRQLIAAAALMAVVAASVAGITWSRYRSGTSPEQRAVSPPQPTPDTPSLPSVSQLITDPFSGQLLLVGCCDPDSRGAMTLVSMWRWNGAQWTHLHPDQAPRFQRNASVSVGDPVSVVLKTGDSDVAADTWIWDGETWIQLHTTVAPQVQSGPIVYDSTRGGVITVAPSLTNGRTETWVFQHGAWTKLPADSPPFFLPPAMTDDPDTQQVVLVQTDGVTNTTWTFANDTWTQRASATDFAPDPTLQLTWDGVYHRVVGLHLGDAAFPLRNSTTPADTWTWDGSTWTKVAAAAAPNENGRLLTTKSGRAVFVGDHMTNGAPDVWEWMGTTWRLRTGDVSDLFSARGFIAFDLNPTLLDAAGWALRINQGRAVVDADQARNTAYVRVPSGDAAHVRLRGSEEATVIDVTDSRNPVLCQCWVEDVLVTRIPQCPGPEFVEAETLVLVDVNNGRVVSTYGRAAAPGTTFGSCQQGPITTP